jgi:glycosyltransferase involved in cell wall biosynthesis
MGRWLRMLGHEVVTVASAAHGGLPDDALTGTRRVADLASSPRLRRLLRRPAGELEQSAVPHGAARIFTDVVVPDGLLLTWAPGAWRAVHRLLDREGFDCMITSGPPHSTHLVGLVLGRSRPPWIADLRDGWRFEPLRPPWPTRAQEALDDALERRVARAADALVGVTRPIAEDLRGRLGVNAVFIPNGSDPDWEASARSVQPPALDPQTYNIVHTGTLGSGGWRDPRALFVALRRLGAEQASGGSRRPRLVLAGRREPELEPLLEGLGDGLVARLGHVPRAQALALQRRADALLLLTSPRHVSHATGKLYEYLAAGRPIIALARGNEAARVVQETGTGIAVPPDDVEAIHAAIRAGMRGELDARFAPRGLERYCYPGPAEAVAALVEELVARRASA